jgi:hypothetical protein
MIYGVALYIYMYMYVCVYVLRYVGLFGLVPAHSIPPLQPVDLLPPFDYAPGGDWWHPPAGQKHLEVIWLWDAMGQNWLPRRLSHQSMHHAVPGSSNFT